MHAGNNWTVIAGHAAGQTQVDSSEYNETCYWYQPIDIHFASKGIKGLFHTWLRFNKAAVRY